MSLSTVRIKLKRLAINTANDNLNILNYSAMLTKKSCTVFVKLNFALIVNGIKWTSATTLDYKVKP